MGWREIGDLRMGELPGENVSCDEQVRSFKPTANKPLAREDLLLWIDVSGTAFRQYTIELRGIPDWFLVLNYTIDRYYIANSSKKYILCAAAAIVGMRVEGKPARRTMIEAFLLECSCCPMLPVTEQSAEAGMGGSCNGKRSCDLSRKT